MWLSLPHLVYNSSDLQLFSTVRLLSWLSYIIVPRPLVRLLNLWNGMFDRHQAKITVMQFRGHSPPVHHSEVGPSPCPILSAELTCAISSHNCHLNVSLPSGASLWIAFLAGSKIQQLIFLLNPFATSRMCHKFNFKWRLTDLSSKVKILNRTNYLAGRIIIVFIHFSMVLAIWKMQTDLSWIPTLLTVSLFFDNNRYNMNAIQSTCFHIQYFYSIQIIFKHLYFSHWWDHARYTDPVSWLHLYRDHLCRGVRPPFNECPDTKQSDGDGSSSAGALENAEYPFIATAPRSTLARSGNTW